MMQRLRGALPLTLALLVGLGAGAAWRARGSGSEGPSHSQHSADTPPVDMGGMDMGDMDMSAKVMGDMSQAADGPHYVIDLANDVCPIMGNEPEGDVYVHWMGLRVQLCCAFCEEGFLADPEGSLREAGVDPTAALDAIAELRAAEGAEREALLEELSSRFHMVELEPGADSR